MQGKMDMCACLSAAQVDILINNAGLALGTAPSQDNDLEVGCNGCTDHVVALGVTHVTLS